MSPRPPDASVIELRQYRLHPGRRDELIALFEREFVETQEATGMRLIGQFRDLDDADRFVWLRGFADMPARAAALTAFYGGPVWRAHRDAANATMLDSDDVLLLRPAYPGAGFAPDADASAAGSADTAGLVVAVVCHFDAAVTPAFLDFFTQRLAPALAAAGAPVIAALATEESENTFPRLPVREGEHVFVWFSRHRDEAAWQRHLAALVASPSWWEQLVPALGRSLARAPRFLRLAPTPRSRLRGEPA